MLLGIDLRQIVARCARGRVHNHRLLGPGNLKVDLEASWNEDQILPIITVQIQTDSFNVLVGSQNLQTLAAFAKTLSTLPAENDSDKSNMNKNESGADVVAKVEHGLNTEQHYVEEDPFFVTRA